jgi:DNA-binding transcriptional regulator of glucitol operon
MLQLLISLAAIQVIGMELIICTGAPQQLVAFQSNSKLIHTRGYVHLKFNINLEKPI